MYMSKLSKGTVLIGLSFSLMLGGCSSETYGLTNKEYRLVDKYYEADKMVEELKSFGYSDEEIERQLKSALHQVEAEAGY